MVALTGGSVTYERKIKPADYESKGAIVQLSFNLEDGADIQAALDRVSALAMGQAHRMVGVNEKIAGAAPTEPVKTKADIEAEKAKELAEKEAAGNPKSRATRPPATKKKDADTKADAASAASVVEEEVTTGAISTTPEDRKNPAEIGDDDLLSPGGDTATTQITDAELTDAITQHNGKVKNAPEIRKLIGEYVKPPATARDIPQDKRAEFVEKLKKVKEPLAK